MINLFYLCLKLLIEVVRSFSILFIMGELIFDILSMIFLIGFCGRRSLLMAVRVTFFCLRAFGILVGGSMGEFGLLRHGLRRRISILF